MILKLCAKLTQYNDISFTNLSRFPIMFIILKIMIIVDECLFVSQQFVLHDKISFNFRFVKKNMPFLFKNLTGF